MGGIQSEYQRLIETKNERTRLDQAVLRQALYEDKDNKSNVYPLSLTQSLQLQKQSRGIAHDCKWMYHITSAIITAYSVIGEASQHELIAFTVASDAKNIFVISQELCKGDAFASAGSFLKWCYKTGDSEIVMTMARSEQDYDGIYLVTSVKEKKG